MNTVNFTLNPSISPDQCPEASFVLDIPVYPFDPSVRGGNPYRAAVDGEGMFPIYWGAGEVDECAEEEGMFRGHVEIDIYMDGWI